MPREADLSAQRADWYGCCFGRAMLDIPQDVRSALYEAIGAPAREIDVDSVDGRIRLSGPVADLMTRDRALAAARVASGLPIEDDLRTDADWGEEAQPKQTEFGDEESARMMTSKDFELLD